MSWELDAGNIRRSWTGRGSLEITGPGDDHFEVRDYVIVFLYVVAVDAIAFFAGLPFTQTHRTVLGPESNFVDPQATIHDAWLYVWLTAVVGIVTVAITAFWKFGRAVVAVLQAIVFTVVLILAVTAVIRAHGQQQELKICQLGAAGPCIGVHRIS